MAKIDSDRLTDIIQRAAALADARDLAGAKRLLMQVPPSQLLQATVGFHRLHP